VPIELLALPKDVQEFMKWSWSQVEPYYHELSVRELTAANLEEWLADWSQLTEMVSETQRRHYVATSVNTADAEAERRYKDFLDNIFPKAQAAEQKLKEKLLASGLKPPHGFEIQLRDMQTEAEIFREANLPLLTEEEKLRKEYDKVIGAQTVTWEGAEVTIQQLYPVFQNPDRPTRERAWRLASQRQLADRGRLNDLWQQFLKLRLQLARNAGFGDYRSFRWKQLLRFDYTPEDCKRFHEAIEQVVVPAATRIYERGREQLQLKSLRPWDLTMPQGFGKIVDPPGTKPLKPFSQEVELKAKCASIFQQVDSQLGSYFNTMMNQQLLDLMNRKSKAPGGYCTSFPVIKRPFIFMNGVGLHRDVQTLIHESGHAFHVFETSHLPYYQQRSASSEFAEVASMGMELLAAPYLAAGRGGFYSETEAARALREHLEQSIMFWPYMAVVDAFQQWVYENHEAALEPATSDAQWLQFWERFMTGVDWSGLEQECMTRWQRQLHIFHEPFYYVEYGLAQLGAVQVWRNALNNQREAVEKYRRALALGGTKPLPELYAAAGAKLAFDTDTLKIAVELMERRIDELYDF